MVKELKSPENKEILNPESIFLLSPVYQPKWYPGDVRENETESLSDKIRGDLIIENLKKANEAGYSVVIVYSAGDNPEFIDALNKIAAEPAANNKIIVKKQDIKGYSEARREAIWEARQPNSGCEVMVMLELEKPLIEHIPEMVLPIINGEADVTITDRQIKAGDVISNDPEGPNENLRDLPRYQARSEFVFSEWANKYLKDNGVALPDSSDLDWMGNRAWRNTSKINSIFLARFDKRFDKDLGPDFDPDHLSSSLFFPLAAILYQNLLAQNSGQPGIKLVSVPVNYRHYKKQSDFENGNPDFFIKRDRQRKMLTGEMVEFVKFLKGQDHNLSMPGLVKYSKI